MKWLSTIAAAIILPATIFAQEQVPQLGKASVKQVVAAMTLEEKAKLVVGMGFRMQSPVPARRDSAERSRTDSANRGLFNFRRLIRPMQLRRKKFPGLREGHMLLQG